METSLTRVNGTLPEEHLPITPAPIAAKPVTVNLAHDAWAYWIDACQRATLFLNVLQERSDRYEEHNSKVAPHVLKFGCELVMDGRKLQRPVNYALVRVLPPDGTEID